MHQLTCNKPIVKVAKNNVKKQVKQVKQEKYKQEEYEQEKIKQEEYNQEECNHVFMLLNENSKSQRKALKDGYTCVCIKCDELE